MNILETTDMALFVRTSAEDLSSWDRKKIVDALVRETDIDEDTAIRITPTAGSPASTRTTSPAEDGARTSSSCA